jgi:predicted esterase
VTQHSPSPLPPHGGRPLRTAGVPLDRAAAAMILVHGRGATAESILELTRVLALPGFAFLAPQAAGGTWYPQSFLAPIPLNEPGISSGLSVIDDLVESIGAAGVPAERTMLLGFSQGGCLASEYVARRGRRLGGLAALSGGLIGPDDTPRDYPGDLAGTPAFLGCSDVDFHIPRERVELTAEVLGRMGAEVDMRLYPGMGHTVNQDEIDAVRAMMERVVVPT